MMPVLTRLSSLLQDTRVFLSTNPYSFGSVPLGTAQQVGEIGSHAPEVISVLAMFSSRHPASDFSREQVVRDASGNWFVTRAGWGQGGLFMAPLTWFDGLDA